MTNCRPFIDTAPTRAPAKLALQWSHDVSWEEGETAGPDERNRRNEIKDRDQRCVDRQLHSAKERHINPSATSPSNLSSEMLCAAKSRPRKNKFVLTRTPHFSADASPRAPNTPACNMPRTSPGRHACICACTKGTGRHKRRKNCARWIR